jgi:enterochelin esterase-like enzyme
MKMIFSLIVLLGVGAAMAADSKAPWKPPLSPEQMVRALQSPPGGKAANDLAGRIIASCGRANVEGDKPRPRVSGQFAVWARTGSGPFAVVRGDGSLLGTLKPLGDGGLHVLAVELPNFSQSKYVLNLGGKRIAETDIKVEEYPVPEESVAKADVPSGRLEKFEFLSRVFSDTRRDVIVYIPAQYRAGDEANLMVWQDGHRHALTNSGLKTPVVMDNLIHAGEMPVTIGVFVEPGRGLNQKPGSKAQNRGFEYDGMGDLYPRFLVEELLPEVERRHRVRFSGDPSRRAIAGGSSGGICAFKCAWERPDQFGRVLSWVGSFVDLRGGHVFPNLVRKTEKKPIKVYLLEGENDLDNPFGNWPVANRKMAAALNYMGYDHKLEWTGCFHGSKAMAAHLPDALRWLWRD